MSGGSEELLDAVVVGGGLAGLGAAFRLRQRGLRVKLLEREGYLGGRTKSGRWEGYWYNLGAQFIGGLNTPVSRLARELGVQTTPVFEPHVAIYLKGKLVVGSSRLGFARQLPWSPWAKLNLLWTALRLRRLRAPMYKNLPREELRAWRRQMDRVSFAQLLGKLHPDVEAFYRVVAEGITAGKMEEVSGYLGLAWTPGLGEPRTEEQPDFEHFFAVENGTVSLAEELGRRLGDAALTEAEVQAVSQDDAGVTVAYTHRGRRGELACLARGGRLPAQLQRF